MDILTSSPAIDNALVDPSNWADEQWMLDQFAWLRENDPVRQLSLRATSPFGILRAITM